MFFFRWISIILYGKKNVEEYEAEHYTSFVKPPKRRRKRK